MSEQETAQEARARLIEEREVNEHVQAVDGYQETITRLKIEVADLNVELTSTQQRSELEMKEAERWQEKYEKARFSWYDLTIDCEAEKARHKATEEALMLVTKIIGTRLLKAEERTLEVQQETTELTEALATATKQRIEAVKKVTVWESRRDDASGSTK